MIYRCPECRAPLGPELACPACAFRAGRLGAVLDFLGEAEREPRAGEVEAFYDRRPFPGYRPGESASSVLDRGRRAPFLHALDRSLPADATVLDCGCGTAQLASFLALGSASRRLFAADASRGALAEAARFRERSGLENLTLLRADLHHLPFVPRSFEVVVSRGVVHHTPDPEAAIRAVAAQVAPGGHLVLAFYESRARAFHGLRQRIHRLRGAPPARLDPVLRQPGLDPGKRATWIDDQYRHPLEHSLPLPRVLATLRSAGLEPLRTVPPAPRRPDALLRPQQKAPLWLRRLDWLLRGLTDPDAGLVSLVARRQLEVAWL